MIPPAARFFALGACGLSIACGTSSSDREIAERIQAVERGLLPAVLAEGQEAPVMLLSSRMPFHGVPGISIAVINGGAIEWTRAYGTAQPRVPVTVETLFQAGSLSKPVTALAALRLVDSGQVDLDADVNGYLESWQIPGAAPPAESAVSLRRLLSHSAGLTVPGFLGYGSTVRIPTLRQVLDGAEPANTPPVRVFLRPGTAWRYSGGGYAVVQQLMSDVARRPFVELMRDLIFEPLGMAHSTFEQPLPDTLAPAAAAGYRRSGATITGRWRTHPELAAAGLWTTPSDLARVIVAIHDAWNGVPGAVLPRDLTRQMLRDELAGWGLGFAVSRVGGQVSFSHTGGNAGYRAFIVGFPETGQGAVIMTNSDTGDALYGEILRAIATVYDWPDYGPSRKTVASVDPAIFDRLVGTYAATGLIDLELDVVSDGSRLIVQGLGRYTRLVPSSDTAYFDPRTGREFVFRMGENGPAVGVTVTGRQEVFASRVE